MTEKSAAGDWSEFTRPAPEWFEKAPFGIFIHWGAYSVPAWAEPIGALGTIGDEQWFAHNPYAEWYYNTIRVDGSPAQEHHRQVHGGQDYDAFLDEWKAEQFDPGEWARLFRSAGADYVIPTTKHHDGIALWDAPGTGTRNTVHRGPGRDLVREIAESARGEGMRFGVYYSGGLDWHARPFPPHTTFASVHGDRPQDSEYAAYAYEHVRDLVDRYAPDILWNDIDWPDGGKHFGDHGLGALFRHFYSVKPDGLVNDRWGEGTHHDYATSEYEHMGESEDEPHWENCRGIGFSFGYNQVEGPEQSMSGRQLARHLVDVVSRGGHFLLNVGPKADGTIPEVQRRSLTELGRWMAEGKKYLIGARPILAGVASPSEAPWVRWAERPEGLLAFVDGEDGTEADLGIRSAQFDLTAAEVLQGHGASLEKEDGRLRLRLGSAGEGPAIVGIPRR